MFGWNNKAKKTRGMEKKIVCRVLTGPTASGKSDIGFRMAATHFMCH